MLLSLYFHVVDACDSSCLLEACVAGVVLQSNINEHIMKETVEEESGIFIPE